MTPEPRPQKFCFCWSCQTSLYIDRTVFVEDVEIPCCTVCWEKMPIADRLRTAQMFCDRAPGGVVTAVATVFRSSLGHFLEERGGQDWLHGTGN